MSDYLLYFAYGSNLHPARLGERLPYCRFIQMGSIQGYQLRFHQIGQDRSAKCDAYYTGDSNDRVYGAVFEIKRCERKILDEYESLGDGYEIFTLQMAVAGVSEEVFLYRAMPNYIDDSLLPFDWYKEFVRLGAEYHRFPATYCQTIRRVKSLQDADASRCQKAERILLIMR